MNIIESIEQLRTLDPSEKRQWYIPEAISTSYAIVECGESLVELGATAKAANVPLILAPANDIDSGRMYMREGAAARLVAAAKALMAETDGQSTLKIYDAFRPLALQRQLFDQIKSDIATKENLVGKALWERVTQFIADPDLTPPHSTGGATDLTIVDIATGQERDMGTPVDTIDDAVNTWHAVAPAARANRELLWNIMTAQGFVNLASEWWHYSYGDQYWAIYQGEQSARYGSKESIPQ